MCVCIYILSATCFLSINAQFSSTRTKLVRNERRREKDEAQWCVHEKARKRKSLCVSLSLSLAMYNWTKLKETKSWMCSCKCWRNGEKNNWMKLNQEREKVKEPNKTKRMLESIERIERARREIYGTNCTEAPIHVCPPRRCRLPSTILSRSRPDPRKDFFVFTLDAGTAFFVGWLFGPFFEPLFTDRRRRISFKSSWMGGVLRLTIFVVSDGDCFLETAFVSLTRADNGTVRRNFTRSSIESDGGASFVVVVAAWEFNTFALLRLFTFFFLIILPWVGLIPLGWERKTWRWATRSIIARSNLLSMGFSHLVFFRPVIEHWPSLDVWRDESRRPFSCSFD